MFFTSRSIHRNTLQLSRSLL
ncbi:unnamed protein product, partial [Allacma fusca]